MRIVSWAVAVAGSDSSAPRISASVSRAMRVLSMRSSREDRVPFGLFGRPGSGRTRSVQDRVLRLLETSHTTREDHEDPPDQLRCFLEQPPELNAVNDEQPDVGRRDNCRGTRLPVEQAHLAEEIARL